MSTAFFWSRIVPVACMVSLSVGQILFKIIARIANHTPLQSSPRGLTLLLISLSLYGVTTIAWIGALRYVPLSAAYPIMALAYVLVPIGAFLFLGERVSPTYWGGVFFLVVALILIGRSQISIS